MGSVEDLPPPSTFTVLDDSVPNDTSLPAFMVSKTRGFLPRAEPVVALPPAFAPLESLLQRMPVRRLDGQPGLLADGRLGDAVLAELPDLSPVLAADEALRRDLPMLNALYRDYAFLASAYLLEPCHLRFLAHQAQGHKGAKGAKGAKDDVYGLGRDVLPANIARPIAVCAKLCGFQPFMEYAGSYALFNYRLADPAAGLQYDNLRLIRAFEHGLDPSSSEAGFVLVHVDMVRHSGPLVAGTCKVLDAAEAVAQDPIVASGSASARATLNEGLAQIVGALDRINGVMETMWAKSRPEQYTSFRTFIFGITSQSMFPEGVAYEGVDEQGELTKDPRAHTRLSFRGESGANDSMIPLMDNLLQIPMPDTPLTAILQDFRKYRPSNHREFLAYVRGRAAALGLRDFAIVDNAAAAADAADADDASAASCRLWLQVLDQVRAFRWRHWCFAKEYILKHTSHPTATGGSPIVTWLPNQLKAVLQEMQAVYRQGVGAATGPAPLGAIVEDIMDVVNRQEATLVKEVARYCEERKV